MRRKVARSYSSQLLIFFFIVVHAMVCTYFGRGDALLQASEQGHDSDLYRLLGFRSTDSSQQTGGEVERRTSDCSTLSTCAWLSASCGFSISFSGCEDTGVSLSDCGDVATSNPGSAMAEITVWLSKHRSTSGRPVYLSECDYRVLKPTLRCGSRWPFIRGRRSGRGREECV